MSNLNEYGAVPPLPLAVRLMVVPATCGTVLSTIRPVVVAAAARVLAPSARHSAATLSQVFERRMFGISPSFRRGAPIDRVSSLTFRDAKSSPLRGRALRLQGSYRRSRRAGAKTAPRCGG